MLADLVPAQAATGLSVGWAVIGGDAEFLAFTTYLQQLLHGRADAWTTDRLSADAQHYRSLLAPQSAWLAGQLTPGDVVVLHDPQTLGMAPHLAEAGLKVVWHCHTGTTDVDATGPAAVWQTFGTELSYVDAVLTTLPEYAPQVVPPARRHVIAPAVDPRSAKNRPLSPGEVAALLAETGLTGESDAGRVEQDEPLPDAAPMVLQVSRWAPLKDIPGVLRSVSALPPDVHVVLAGTDPDDPDGRAVLDEVRASRADLSGTDRARVHLVLLPRHDDEQAALAVNALQRRADVVLQKSLTESFGLAVTEAMVKGRAVVAADVGGLRQQIFPGHSGLLVDPRDSAAVAHALRTLLDDPLLRGRLGRAAAESANRRYLMPRLVADYQLIAPEPLARAPEAA
jgi:trehalose synthase